MHMNANAYTLMETDGDSYNVVQTHANSANYLPGRAGLGRRVGS
jgi:hypothetical protein